MSKTTMQELARRWVWDDDEDALTEYCQREAARLHAEETMSETTNTPTRFSADLDDCSFAAVQYELASDPEARICQLSHEATRALLAEYQRQLAAAGFVVLRREDALTLLDAHGELNAEGLGVQGGTMAVRRVAAAVANQENR